MYTNQPNSGKVGKNPVDSTGNITRCEICDSINHWAGNCPDNKSDEKAVKATHAVNLYQSSLLTDQSLKQLTGESLSAAVLDSGASRTVCGQFWMNCYLETLNESELKDVETYESNSVLKFGDGQKIESMKKMKIPARIGFKNVKIETDAVNTNIPLLLSKASMKKANTDTNLKQTLL